MLRIGIFTELFFPRISGGGEVRYLNIAENLVKRGHKVTVITTSIPGRPSSEVLDNGIHIIRMGVPHPPASNSLLASIVYFLVGFLRLRRFTRHRFDIIESNTYIPSYLASLVSKIAKVPHIMTVHDVYMRDWKSRLGTVLTPFGILLEKGLRFLKRRCVVTVSNASMEKLVKILGFDKTSIRIVPNGISFDVIRTAEKGKEQNTIVYVGRLLPHKNVEHAITAFASIKQQHPQVRMLIIGSGPSKVTLEKLVARLSLEDSILFTGYLDDRNQVYSLLKSGYVFVSPSSVEGFGIAALEAMAAGTPPVLYDLPAYRMFVKANVNAVVVEEGDIDGLTQAILGLIENPAQQKKLVENGIKTARAFSWENISEQMLKIYFQARKSP